MLVNPLTEQDRHHIRRYSVLGHKDTDNLIKAFSNPENFGGFDLSIFDDFDVSCGSGTHKVPTPVDNIFYIEIYRDTVIEYNEYYLLHDALEKLMKLCESTIPR